MSIWDLYRKPVSVEGELVEGLNARYFTGVETTQLSPTNSAGYLGYLGGIYFMGLASYIVCSRYRMRAQRLTSSMIMTFVPIIILCHKKGDDNPTGLTSRQSLEERLDYYPVTRRALERAIEDVVKKN